MTNEELILDFIRTELLGEAELAVGVDDELLLDGILDSLAVMRLITYLEKTTGNPIPPEDVTLENFQSINSIAAYLQQPAGSL